MYTVIEMQTTGETMSVLTPVVKSDRNTAEQEYHMKLAYAAVSAVEYHTVVLLNAEGQTLKKECYKHEQAE